MTPNLVYDIATFFCFVNSFFFVNDRKSALLESYASFLFVFQIIVFW